MLPMLCPAPLCSRFRHLALALLAAVAVFPLPARAQSQPVMQLHEVIDCLDRSQALTEQNAAAFHTDCEIRPFEEMDVLQACADSAGGYCQGLVRRMAEPAGPLAFITSVSGRRAIFQRKALKPQRLNRDPVIDLLILDGTRESTYRQQVLVIGCSTGRGSIQFLRDRPRADSPFEVVSHVAWSQAAQGESDEVGRYVCKRDEAGQQAPQ